jgi:hypothetical protein
MPTLYFGGTRGATVARLTPDQKVVRSNRAGFKFFFDLKRCLFFLYNEDE